MNSPGLVEVRNLVFGYDRTRLIDDISFSVPPNDFLVVIGPNGGGKTTLAKLILGLLHPWSGEVINHFSTGHGRIGYVPQFSGFDWQFPLLVRDVIAMGRLALSPAGRRFTRADRQAVGAIADRMQITGLLDNFVGELSGGELQRVLIARALVSDPEFLILDEPTASISSDSRKLLNDILTDLNRKIAIMMISHDATVITSQVKRIACVNRKLYLHDSGELPADSLEKVYGCPVEMIAHGIPHRVLGDHRH